MKALLALDLSYLDKYLLNFLSVHHKKLGNIKKVYCLSVDKNPDIPEEVKELLSLDEKGDENRRLINEELKQHINPELDEVFEIVLENGTFEEEVLNYANEQNVDLMILGHKPRTDGTGLHARRIASQTSADVLFLPGKEIELRKIVVPVDFSSLSEKALNKAIQIAREIPDASIHCIHVYEAPTRFALNKTLHSEINERMKKVANSKMEAFISDIDTEGLKLETVTIRDEGYGLASTISDEAAKRGADMIIMGSRGETFIAWILLGSTAEKLIYAVEDIPLMIVK